MNWWSPAHQALLNALDAQDVVPDLFLMLTDGLIQANADDTRRLRDWPEALRDSAAWAVLAHAISTKRITAWNEAQLAGFTDRAAHHNALVLMALSERLAEGRQFEASLRCLRWSLKGWKQIYASGYLTELANDLDAQISAESMAEIISNLLRPTLETRQETVLEELRKSAADLDVDALAYGRQWFDAWQGFTPFGTPPSFSQFTTNVIAQRLLKAVTDADLTSATDAAIEAPFRLAWRQIKALDYPAPAMCELIGHLISTLWTLRRVGRDTIPAFNTLVDIGILIAPQLAQSIETGESLGQNSRLADLYVFRAERDRGEPRREFLVLALKYCPGHRNASMLMSYLHLHTAQAALTELTTTVLPSSVKSTLQRAYSALGEAEAAFPLNEDLAEHREQFQKACLKNKVDPGSFHAK